MVRLADGRTVHAKRVDEGDLAEAVKEGTVKIVQRFIRKKDETPRRDRIRR